MLQEQEAFAQVHTIDETREKYYNAEPIGDERGDLLVKEIGGFGGGGFGGLPGKDIIDKEEPEDTNKSKERKKFRRYAQKRLDEGKPEEINKFRFDYLEKRIQDEYRLTAFAFLSEDVPPIMTRMQAVGKTGSSLNCPLVIMDNAAASILGATLDSHVSARSRIMVVNVGNFHTLAFRLGPTGIEGIFEHHTGLIDQSRLETMLRALADGSLTHREIFDSHGHGALIRHPEKLDLEHGDFGVVVTGPRRSMMLCSDLRPYFAVPYGDMMLTGCFGLLVSVSDLVEELEEPIRSALKSAGVESAPWDITE